MRTAVDPHIAFALALDEALAPAGTASHVCSPWSVSSALAMLAPGTDDAARGEIEASLAAGSGVRDVVARLASDAAVAARPGEGDESVLEVANTLWVEETRTPVPAFVDGLGKWPGARERTATLIADPERARQVVNADVARATHALIREILPPGSLTEDDRAVLVNALYLLAGWLEPFSEDRTAEEPFHAPSGNHPVPTMRGEREDWYAVAEGWEYLALPLGRGLRVEVLLPPAAGSTGALARPRPELVGRLRAAASEHRVDLHLPRFRVRSDASLIEPLRALGVRRVLDVSKRAVTGVVEQERLYVSGAFHAARLRVDERGVEGAAATAIVARAVAYRELPEVEMRVDRPFWFLVAHRESGAVLFLAQVVDPS